MADNLTDKDVQLILDMTRIMCQEILYQFSQLSPIVATGLQLSMIWSLAIIWASQTDTNPQLIFDNIMATMPHTIKDKIPEGFLH
jgi:hypothetical protein